MGEPTPDVVVVGGGVIGLATAWRAAGRGLSVTVCDPAPGSGASTVAAGMLAPVTEAHYTEQALLRLTLDSAARWPALAAELADATGIDPAYRETGTVLAAADGGDLAMAEELHAFQQSLGLSVDRLTGREVRTLEPMLAPGIRGGLFVAGDHQVDPRRLIRALLAACATTGVTVRPDRVSAVRTDGDSATGVVLGDGTSLAAGQVLLAAGCWTGAIDGVPEGVLPTVRPVKGQLLRLQVPEQARPFLRHNLRGIVRGASIYLVPRADGELVLGATMEEQGFDTTVTAGAIYELLRDAREILPGITELTVTETQAGLRPATADNMPVLGATALPGLVLATGHFRNGILLAPVTADAVAAVLAGEATPEVARPFSPDRLVRPPSPMAVR
ncbi:glycine oxidase ThiO [Sporichthya sp.]|uniref:glycine oxidase ThiO n=1 Tax=Sporichthya sp. TaxID=65475 RepID=UPI0025F4B4E9|nr:glycine oxidase ThiO [Sporichthya sp.]